MVHALIIFVGHAFLCCTAVAKQQLLLWNRFESRENVVNSNIGPGFQLTSFKIPDWTEAKIVPAKFGNGLFVDHGIDEGWNNTGANFFSLDLSEVGDLRERGSVEFWFKFLYDSTTSNHAYFFRPVSVLAGPSGHYEGSTFPDAHGLGGGWAGWNGRKFFFEWISRPEGAYYDETPPGSSVFETNSLHHFGFSWDVSGIDGTADTMRVYVDGTHMQSRTPGRQGTGKWSTDEPFARYTYLGTSPNVGRWDTYYNAVKGVTDNLKIWNFAKTDFTDRFVEGFGPTAIAGDDRTFQVGDTVKLDGSNSYGMDNTNESLTYLWRFTKLPACSRATLENEDSMAPSFVPDIPGIYHLSLVVAEEEHESAPDSVEILASGDGPTCQFPENLNEVTCAYSSCLDNLITKYAMRRQFGNATLNSYAGTSKRKVKLSKRLIHEGGYVYASVDRMVQAMKWIELLRSVAPGSSNNIGRKASTCAINLVENFIDAYQGKGVLDDAFLNDVRWTRLAAAKTERTSKNWKKSVFKCMRAIWMITNALKTKTVPVCGKLK